MDIGYEIAELKRIMGSLIRLGTVAAVQADPPRVKVAIGDLTTAWRPWMEEAAGTDTTWDPPSDGEQVLVLSPFGDLAQAVILRGLNQTANPAPETSLDKVVRKFGDGSLVEYNRKTHTLSLDIKGPVNLTATGDVTVITKGKAYITADGDASITTKGKATVKANGGIDNSGDGSTALMGSVNGHCICPLTGKPHLHVSSTVRSSK